MYTKVYTNTLYTLHIDTLYTPADQVSPLVYLSPPASGELVTLGVLYGATLYCCEYKGGFTEVRTVGTSYSRKYVGEILNFCVFL